MRTRLVDSARDETAKLLAGTEHVGKGVGEGGGSLHCREADLTDTRLAREAKDAPGLVVRAALRRT